MTIAILGWGSLIWDKEKGKEFDEWREGDWDLADGLKLPLEFSRISKSRGGALTLVVDIVHGTECQVQCATSKRKDLNDVIRDLGCREGTNDKNIGFCRSEGPSSPHSCSDRICEWAKEVNFEAVVWTALPSNYSCKEKEDFSVDGAYLYLKRLKRLSPKGWREAAEYFGKAPGEIRTKLRNKVDAESLFD